MAVFLFRNPCASLAESYLRPPDFARGGVDGDQLPAPGGGRVIGGHKRQQLALMANPRVPSHRRVVRAKFGGAKV